MRLQNVLTCGLTEPSWSCWFALRNNDGWLRSDDGEVFVAVDQGGHTSRAVAYDGRGQRLASAFAVISTHRNALGHVEHDGEDIVGSVRTAPAALAVLVPAARWSRVGLAVQLRDAQYTTTGWSFASTSVATRTAEATGMEMDESAGAAGHAQGALCRSMRVPSA